MIRKLKQIIPSQHCIHCDVCCRYPERTTAFTPFFFPREAAKNQVVNKGFYAIGKKIDLKTPPMPYEDHYICHFFIPDRNTCSIYASRPFDCQLYPFMVTYGRDFSSVLLVLDTKCPYLKDKIDSKEVRMHADYLTNIIESDPWVEEINKNKNFINEFQEDSIVLKKLEKLSRRLCLGKHGLRRISLKERNLFEEYFSKTNVLLSSFSFAAIYLWSGVLNILWKKIDTALCVFAGNDKDYFLLLPPLDHRFNKYASEQSLEILRSLNKEGMTQRIIENFPQQFSAMASFGSNLKIASQEYIYSRKDLAELKGNRFKAKRALVNSFMKNYKYTCRAFEKNDIFNCLELYLSWGRLKLSANNDDYFRFLIEDSYLAQKTALLAFEPLNLQGIVVEVNGLIKGYSIGYALNKDTFVILFETTDLKIKGLAQFIFREFCLRLPNYEYINTLGDSGLENLKKIKDSYQPIKKIPLFTASF